MGKGGRRGRRARRDLFYMYQLFEYSDTHTEGVPHCRRGLHGPSKRAQTGEFSKLRMTAKESEYDVVLPGLIAHAWGIPAAVLSDRDTKFMSSF